MPQGVKMFDIIGVRFLAFEIHFRSQRPTFRCLHVAWVYASHMKLTQLSLQTSSLGRISLMYIIGEKPSFLGIKLSGWIVAAKSWARHNRPVHQATPGKKAPRKTANFGCKRASNNLKTIFRVLVSQ